jgi:hypothetical protein
MSTEQKIFDKSTEEKFDLLKLINHTDIDAFLKVLLLVDEKTANNIRGEFSHAVIKHIEADHELKEKFIANNHAELNYNRLINITKNIKNAKIEHYKNNIKKVILDGFSAFGFKKFMKVIDIYFRYNENHETAFSKVLDNQITMCEEIGKNLDAIFYILTPNMEKIYLIYYDNDWGPTEDGANVLTSFRVHFSKFCEKDYTTYTIYINFEITDLPEKNISDNITQLHDYYHYVEPEKTLAYYQANKNTSHL